MTETARSKAVALSIVIVVVLAALAVGVILKDFVKDDSNPNGILGTYEIVDYTQYGTTFVETPWKFYETGDGSYDDEKISIDTYKDHVITGTCYLGGKENPIVGYYDPDTGAFGYGSSYTYTPDEQEERVIDSINGEIVNDTMYLRGYTISTENESSLMYTFNFTFVKEGKTPEPKVEFKQVITQNTEFKSEVMYYTYIDEDGNPHVRDEHGGIGLGPNYFTITLGINGFKNGVYDLKLGNDILITATTMYQDENVTYIKGVAYYVATYHVLWFCVDNNGQLSLIDSHKDTELQNEDTIYKDMYLMSLDGSESEFDVPDLNNRLMGITDDCYSMYMGTHARIDDTHALFKTQYEHTLLTPLYSEGKWIFVGSLPYIDHVAFNPIVTNAGSTYYGDLLGSVDDKGNIVTYGFFFGENGDIVVSLGSMKCID